MNQPPTAADPTATEACAGVLRKLLNVPVVKALLATPDIALAEHALQTLTARAEKADKAERAAANQPPTQ